MPPFVHVFCTYSCTCICIICMYLDKQLIKMVIQAKRGQGTWNQISSEIIVLFLNYVNIEPLKSYWQAKGKMSMQTEYTFIVVRMTLAALPNQYLRADTYLLTHTAPFAPCWTGNVDPNGQPLPISFFPSKVEYKRGSLLAISTTEPDFRRQSQYASLFINTYYSSTLTHRGLFTVM